MKKYFSLMAIAAAVMLGFASCSDEEKGLNSIGQTSTTTAIDTVAGIYDSQIEVITNGKSILSKEYAVEITKSSDTEIKFTLRDFSITDPSGTTFDLGTIELDGVELVEADGTYSFATIDTLSLAILLGNKLQPVPLEFMGTFTETTINANIYTYFLGSTVVVDINGNKRGNPDDGELPTLPEQPLSFDFEHFEMISNGRYVNYYELDSSGRRHDIWATANAGYAMCGLSTFPTQRYDRGQSGNGVCLRTETTGGFGTMTNPPMPIAAGSLFIGRFDALNAVSSPRTATLFGMPFDKTPKAFTGYYMFKPGETMTDDSGAVIKGETDRPDFYVVMYENYDIVDGRRQSIMLDGNNVLTHKNIVGLARIKEQDIVNLTDEQIERGEWQYFDIPFELVNGKQIDPERLANYGYNVAIVISSSVDGAYFRGAVGSTLYIDTIKIICED